VNLNANKIRKDPVPLIYRGFLPEKVEKNPKEKQWDPTMFTWRKIMFSGSTSRRM